MPIVRGERILSKYIHTSTSFSVSTRVSFDNSQRASTPLSEINFGGSGMLYRAGTLVCILLVFLTSFVGVAHFHANEAGNADRSCSLCALAHVGIAINNVATPAPIFAASALCETPAIVSRSFRPLSSNYIRPPPQA